MSEIDLVPHLPDDWKDIRKDVQYEEREMQNPYRFKSKFDGQFDWYPRRQYQNRICIANFQSAKSVMNPYIYSRFLLRQEEYKSRGISFNIVEMYHATSTSNVKSILEGNLDWRRTSRDKFGKGVSFSPSIEYANKACNSACGDNRTIVVCDVIVGSTCIGEYDMALPLAETDTSTDGHKLVYVKYYDDEFCPKYLINYDIDIKNR